MHAKTHAVKRGALLRFRPLDGPLRPDAAAKRPATPTEEEIVAKLYPDRAKLQKEIDLMVTLTFASWNRIGEGLRRLDDLRRVA